MYADLTSTLRIERIFPIDLRLKEIKKKAVTTSNYNSKIIRKQTVTTTK